MKTNHKKFKAFDKVLVRDIEDGIWKPSFYQFFNEERGQHADMVMNYLLDDFEILPYEGNEALVGTTDEPEEEVKLEKGEWIFVSTEASNWPTKWSIVELDHIEHEQFCIELIGWSYAIRFSDFNPNDMEETSRHILCVKNGKIVKYKG